LTGTKGWTVNEIPSTPGIWCVPPLLLFSGRRVAGAPPCPRSPPRSIDPWYAGMRDDDDAAWLMVRLRRPTSSPDALGGQGPCSLEAPRVDVSGSGAGPVGARSRWRTLHGSRYSGVRAGETGNSSHGGDLRRCPAPASQWARGRTAEVRRNSTGKLIYNA